MRWGGYNLSMWEVNSTGHSMALNPVWKGAPALYPGAPIWADDRQNGNANHVRMVEKVEDGSVYTIEGNSGDMCWKRSCSVEYYEILSYGILQVGGTDNNNETPIQ